ncbi:MAG TPA: RNA polymerase sigma factor [Devosiaceae bacterium]|nr:RNA polymerase sigma factor [Devosiaceae bacterium]
MAVEPELIADAQGGGRQAFDALVTEAMPKMRRAVRAIVGHPEDSEDVIQTVLIKAWQGLPKFEGRSAFSTWLVSIAVRQAIDHLRAQKRWRRESQIAYANLCAGDEELSGELMGVMAAPDFSFEVREHVAYCFVCMGRSLPPDEQAALVLSDVMDMSNREASNVLGISDSVLRHRLAAARQLMESRYEGLCALVNKNGMCHQCAGLGEAARAVGGKASELVDIETLADRMAIIRGLEPDATTNDTLHDVFFRRCKQIEDDERGAITVESDC